MSSAGLCSRVSYRDGWEGRSRIKIDPNKDFAEVRRVAERDCEWIGE